MTIDNLAPREEKRSGRKKSAVDEKSPLLPSRQDEGSGFNEFSGASFSGAVFNLSTTIIGAGIMALPAMVKELGLFLGVAMIIFMAFLTEASIELLLRFSRPRKSASYGGLMGDAFGRYGKIVLQICVLINNIGVLTVYMIIIGGFQLIHKLITKSVSMILFQVLSLVCELTRPKSKAVNKFFIYGNIILSLLDKRLKKKKKRIEA